MRPRRFLTPGFKRLLRNTFLGLLLWTVLETFHIRQSVAQEAEKEPGALGKERIFIASIHWNNEAILRSYWVPSVVALAKEIGRDNVFVSVYESGSWDDSKGALRDLDRQLADADIPRQVILDPETHQDTINEPPGTEGWIQTPRGKTQLRRIPYLAKLRNKVLEPLLGSGNASRPFDKVLFLNDVAFTTKDVRRLLATRHGDYAAACSLDFSKAPNFYDTFALRDSAGHAALMQQWPFFRASRSRKAILKSQAVPVYSCWNGIVAMDAMPFLQSRPLKFRGVPDTLATHHLEGSECCLIHADNPLSAEKGVWLNPNVRVGYNPAAYRTVNPTRDELWLSTWSIASGLWRNRISRWFSTPWFGESIVRRRLRSWEKRSAANVEQGSSCIINEMHVLVGNGWAHV